VFTFSCPTCHKQHSIDEPFTESFETHCFRCQSLIQVTKQIIRIDPRSKKVVRPTTPTPASTKSTSAPATTKSKPSPQLPIGSGRLGRWKWLASGLVSASLLSLGLGGYVMFGGGVPPATKKTTPATPQKSTNVVASLPNRAAVQPPNRAAVQPALNPKTNPAKETSPNVSQRIDNVTPSKNVTPAKNAPSIRRPLVPLEVVREAFEKRFAKKVVVTTVRVENGNLTLEGALLHWEDLRPAREVAVQALETAGFGPIRSWDNHLKKPKQ
jgi:hypothetical protein